MSFSLPSEADNAPDPVLILRGTVLTAAEEQKKWAQEALSAVTAKAAIMQEGMDQGKGLRFVIRAAASVLDELRTNLLEPQNYYELYMKVFTVMESVATYFEDAYHAGQHTLEEIYEEVQYCGYIVPRLYLLVTAGAVYTKVGQQPALEIMRDLVEMSKGVQHPTRGLFLRHFVLTMMKSRLPGDPGRPAESSGGDTSGGGVADTANLLVQNFKEMNWLWIRMEAGSYVNRNGGSTNSVSTNANAATLPPTPPPTAASPTAAARHSPPSTNPTSPRSPASTQQRSMRAAQRTLQERKAMCVLVGMNLVRISQLDGITREVYATTLLPQLLSVMVRYCEPLAQQYLFEVLIQVFPDEFHLFTIHKLFDAISRTVHGVDVSGLLRSLMERLCTYAMEVQDGVTDVSSPEEEAQLRDLFPMLLDRMANMPVSYKAQIKGSNVIKRTSAVPPPTPMLLSTFVGTVRHLVTVAIALYSKSAKRRTMALANIVDVVAAKFTAASSAAAATAATGGENGASSASADAAAAASSDSNSDGSKKTNAVGISAAAALAAGQLLCHIITECCATVTEVLAMEGVEALTACLPFCERRDVAMAVCELALRGSTAAPLLPSTAKTATTTAAAAAAAMAVVTAAPPRARPITALEDVARLFELMDPLLVDQPDTPSDPQLIYRYNPKSEFADEQNSVCRVLQLITNDDPAVYLKMLTGVRKLLLLGGARRLPLTFPTLLAMHRRAALRLRRQFVAASAAAVKNGKESKQRGEEDGEAVADGEGAERDSRSAAAVEALEAAYRKNIRKCFSHLYSGDGKGVLEVYAEEVPRGALSEYVSSALTADGCDETETSYTLFAEALTLYDTQLSDTADQVNALVSFVNALAQMTALSEENYEVLAAKVCQYASKLLKKQDQSRLIAVCATLFARKQLSQENQARVQECLRRALKLAGQVLALAQLQLYVQLLNVFLHFYTSKMSYLVSVELVNELVEKINEASEAQRTALAPAESEGGAVAAPAAATAAGAEEAAAAASAFASIRLVYRNITKYIRSRQAAEERWSAIEV